MRIKSIVILLILVGLSLLIYGGCGSSGGGGGSSGSSGGGGSDTTTPPTETVSTPNAPTGQTSGYINTSYSYTTGGAESSSGHSIEYQFDWQGDGIVLSTWWTASQSKTWSSTSIYLVRARARCQTHTSVVSEWSSELSVNIDTPAPTETISTPSQLTGPVTGAPGTSYSYTTWGVSSNLGHAVEYQFDWTGDASDLSGWGPAYQSKTWSSAGAYPVKARARCATHTTIVSEWSFELLVNIIAPWTKQFGTASYDWATGVATDANGNIYVAGGTNGGLDGNTFAGEYDGFVVKYNPAGEKQWTRQIGSSAYDVASGVTADTSGNIYVVGLTYGGLDGNTMTQTNAGFVVKYNPAGERQWTKLFSPANHNGINGGIASDPSGNIYVTGYTIPSKSSCNGFVVKYNPAGVEQWTKKLDSYYGEYFSYVTTDLSGNIYVVGETYNSSFNRYDGLVIRYNSDGEQQWARRFSLFLPVVKVSGVATDSNGNIFATGHTKTEACGYDGFVVKYNPAGVEQWTKQFGTVSDDVPKGVTTDTEGNVYVTGSTSGGLGGTDGFVIKYNSTGEKQWTRQFGSIFSGDIAYDIATDANGNIYVVGVTEGGLDGNTNAGYEDAFVVKYNSAGVKQ